MGKIKSAKKVISSLSIDENNVSGWFFTILTGMDRKYTPKSPRHLARLLSSDACLYALVNIKK